MRNPWSGWVLTKIRWQRRLSDVAKRSHTRGADREAARRQAERSSRTAAAARKPADDAARLTRGNNRWDALDQVKGTAETLRSVTRRLDRQVLAARAAGATWVDLGRVLGVSPQAVQQKYGAPPKPGT